MQSPKKIRSTWTAFIAVALLLLCIWSTLLINKRPKGALQASVDQEKKSWLMALPNILAPVIRHEVHKEFNEQEKIFVLSSQLPRLWQIFKVRQ